MKRKLAATHCPCGSGRDYAACCAPLHGGAAAADAGTLMRSRYSAYALGLADYVLATWHPSTRPAELDLHDGPKWIGLDVLRHERTGEDAAIVEFVARFKAGGRAGRMREASRFVREGGRWYYVDGEQAESA